MTKGVRFGRKPKLTAHQRQEAIARRDAGETLVEIARSYNVDPSMVSRLTAHQAKELVLSRAAAGVVHCPSAASLVDRCWLPLVFKRRGWVISRATTFGMR